MFNERSSGFLMIRLGSIIVIFMFLVPACSMLVSDPYELKVSSEVMELISAWDKDIWFYTARANPIASLSGLSNNDIACGGMEFFHEVLSLYKVIGIESGEVHVIMTGNKIFDGMANPPKLYINWSNQKPNLQGSVRVVFVRE